MLATLVPVFNDKMLVSAYIVYARKNEIFKNPLLLGTASPEMSLNSRSYRAPVSEFLQATGRYMFPSIPLRSIRIFRDSASHLRKRLF